MQEQRRQTTPRRDLARHENFDEVSPDVGVLDEGAFDRALSEDADQALTLLGELIGATDVRLRELARNLAGRLAIDLTRSGEPRARGIGRLRRRPADRAEGDIDVDASLEALVRSRSLGEPPALDELTVAEWGRHQTAICLVVDRSGSMGGDRLTTAAIAAAACAWRSPQDWSMLAFSNRALVLKGQREHRPVEAVVDDVLLLRGFGTTDVSLALRTAAAQLSLANAGRRLCILLSDCRPTEGEDPALAAAMLDELVIVAPAGDTEDAALLASQVGARWVELAGPSGVPAAFARLLDR
ncbi:MAG: VWA domain-containing protein [Acidimicrobiia bacterium]|nr:VWA domain-containing protein [Acidimicrobiia bacterium]